MLELTLADIQNFYESAWDKLIISSSVLFVAMTLTVLIFIYFVNYRYFKIKIEKRFDIIKYETIANIKEEYKEDMKIVRQEYHNKSKALRGIQSTIEGKIYLTEKKTELATESFLEAIKGYLHGKDYKNFKLASNIVIDKCLPELTKLELNKIFRKMSTTQDEYFSELKKIDRSEYSRDEIAELMLKCDLIEVNDSFLKKK